MIERLPWDSSLFGFPIGRLNEPPSEHETLAARVAELGLRCLYYYCDAEDSAGIGFAACCNFRLADVRVRLAASADRLAEHCSVSGAEERDQVVEQLDQRGRNNWEELIPVARSLAQRSRFAFDPAFGEGAARRLYREWIRVSCEGRANPIIVARRESSPIGLITCVADGDTADLELVAVLPEAAGQGIGRLLVARSAEALRNQGIRELGVATQVRNVAALNFYQAVGFEITRAELVYHGWYDVGT